MFTIFSLWDRACMKKMENAAKDERRTFKEKSGTKDFTLLQLRPTLWLGINN